MKKWIKILLIGISTPIIIAIILIVIYITMNWQGVIEPYHTGNSNAPIKVLIASQGSEFKNDLLKNIVQKLKNDTLYLSVIDCTSLKKENASDWKAIIIIHTTKAHKIPRYVSSFLDDLPDYSNIVLICTSGGGDEVISEYEIDAISTASRMSETNNIANLAISKVERILQTEIN